MPSWPYIPSYGFITAYEWLTDIITVKSRKEFRACMRKLPRMEVIAKYQLTEREYTEASTLAKELSATNFNLPVWSEAVYLGAVTAGTTVLSIPLAGTTHATSRSLFIIDNTQSYEIRTVQTIGVDSITLTAPVTGTYSDAFVVPLVLAEFAQSFTVERTEFDKVVASARFRTQDTQDLGSGGGFFYPTYLTHPVVQDRPLIDVGVSEEYLRAVEEIDSETGAILRVPVYTIPEQRGTLSWSTQTLAELKSLKEWLHSRRGKWRGFWVLSWNADYTLAADIASIDTTLTIQDANIRNMRLFPFYLAVIHNNETQKYVRVNSATSPSPGVEVLQLSAAFGAAWSMASVDKITRLTFSRFDSDRAEIVHNRGGGSRVTMPITEVPTP